MGYGDQLPKKTYGFQAFCILPKDFTEISVSNKASLYVTGFAKRGLVRTLFQVSLFTAIRQIQQ